MNFLVPCPHDLTGSAFDLNTRVYPPKPEDFFPLDFYWPNEHGRYYQYFQSIIPNYPVGLQQLPNKSALEYLTRLLGYRDMFDAWMFRNESVRWKGFEDLGFSRMKCEYYMGTSYSFYPNLLTHCFHRSPI